MNAEVPDFSCSPGNIAQDNITFQLQGNSPPKEIIRLDSEGFHYRGQLIEDAGEAHRLFIEFMRQSNDMRHINQPTPTAQPVAEGPSDEELLRVAATAIDPYESSGIALGEYEPETECAVEVYGSELIAYARAALAKWGHQ